MARSAQAASGLASATAHFFLALVLRNPKCRTFLTPEDALGLLRSYCEASSKKGICVHLKPGQVVGLTEASSDTTWDSRDWASKLRKELHVDATIQHKSILRLVSGVCENLERRCEHAEEPLGDVQEKYADLHQKYGFLKDQVNTTKMQSSERELQIKLLDCERREALDALGTARANIVSLVSRAEQLE